MITFRELRERKAMSLSARRKKARAMSKLAKSSAFKAKVARAKIKRATPEKIKAKALKQAKMVIIKKYANLTPADYAKLGPIQKQQLDNKITSKKQGAIRKIAKRLEKKIKSAESERIAKNKESGKE